MQVASLLNYLIALKSPLKSAGVTESKLRAFEAACDRLAPFGQMEIDAFATLLAQAEEYHRTGILPAAPAKAAKAAKNKAPALPVADVVRQVSELRTKVMTQGYSLVEAQNQATILTKSFKKADLTEVATALGAQVGKKDTVATLREAINRRLHDAASHYQQIGNSEFAGVS